MDFRQNIISKMGQGTIEAFIFHAVGVSMLFLMHIVLGRLIGPEGYGIYSYTLAVAGILALIVPLGWPTALMRFVAQYSEKQDWGLFRGVFIRSHQTTFISSLFFALLLVAVSYLVNIPSDKALSLRFSALLLPILSFVALRRKALQALHCIKSSIAFEEILLPLLVIILSLATLLSILVKNTSISQTTTKNSSKKQQSNQDD